MSSATENKEQVVSSAIREISHIATLPEITLKIVELVEDPKSTAQDLHKVISNDPALCSRILKVVNSSFYGLPGQIASINRAIVMLGLNAVKNIAIAASLAKLFRGGELTPNFSARDLWNHSTAVAATCKVIADSLRLGLSDEAFLAGLIHDIGVMVEMQYDRNKLIEVLETVKCDSNGVPQCNMRDVEHKVFGATHTEFGAGLAEKWKFPKSFSLVTGYHHTPLELPAESRTLTTIVHIADRLACEAAPGFRLDLQTLEVGADVRDAIKLSSEKFEEIRKNLPAALKNVGNLLA
ncbi:MAG: HDOD domain-containing protein [Phycisphaerales bacterium]|nr:HDOD domain-containing protein [Phycisphaerales bacterium]